MGFNNDTPITRGSCPPRLNGDDWTDTAHKTDDQLYRSSSFILTYLETGKLYLMIG